MNVESYSEEFYIQGLNFPFKMSSKKIENILCSLLYFLLYNIVPIFFEHFKDNATDEERPNETNEAPGQPPLQKLQRLTPVASILLCTPGTGVSLWGESPLYENRKVFMTRDPNKSTSRRQARLREEGAEGSRSANVRTDGQKPHRRLSLWASWHNTTKPTGSGGRVNAAVVHRKLTFLSGEICLSRASQRGRS